MRSLSLEFLQQGGDLGHPHLVHCLVLLHGLHSLQLGLELLQLLLDAAKLEVVLTVIVLGQGFSDEVFPLFLQLIYFGTYGVLAVRCFRGSAPSGCSAW